MGTRARIGILEPDGSVTSIYSHWDGYVSHHGPILRDHYKTEAKVRALMALGDISKLDVEIGEKHNFDNAPRGVCNAYGRDRGEEDTEARRESYDTFTGHHSYSYLFDPAKAAWSLARTDTRLQSLEEAIIADQIASESDDA